MAQIDADGLAHDKLQEQNNHEVFKFIVHNDTIAKLRAEVCALPVLFDSYFEQKADTCMDNRLQNMHKHFHV